MLPARMESRREGARPRTLWPLPHGLAIGDDEAVLRPWRTFKLDPRFTDECEGQLAFDYWGRPEQPGDGQLWLL